MKTYNPTYVCVFVKYFKKNTTVRSTIALAKAPDRYRSAYNSTDFAAKGQYPIIGYVAISIVGRNVHNVTITCLILQLGCLGFCFLKNVILCL